MLAQTLQDFELLVVDDGSTDGTAAAVGAFDDPRIRLHRHERNRGQAEAWNTAVRLALGERVKFLPADDLLLPECLERLAAADVDFAFCRRRVEGEGLPGWRERYGAVHEDFAGDYGFERWLRAGLRDNWVGEPTVVLARRELLHRAGPFNRHVEGAVDMDLWARALLYARNVSFVDEELVVLRLHGGSVTARVHGRPRASLDRAWLLHGLLRHADRPELRSLRREAEVRFAKDWLRSPRRVRGATAYLVSRLARR